MIDVGTETMRITPTSAISKVPPSTDDTTNINTFKLSGPATTLFAAVATEHDGPSFCPGCAVSLRFP